MARQFTYPTLIGNASKQLTVKSDESGVEWAAAGGSGTVTSVSVVTANGVSGSVATATTTPAITLTLGAITPTSIGIGGAASGALIHLIDGTSANMKFEKTGANAGTFQIYNDGFANMVGPGSSPNRRFAFYDQIGAGNGNNVATPAFTNFNDTNTGIYFPDDTDKIGIVTGGIERLRVDNAGVVSIYGSSTQAGELRIYEDTDDGTNYTAFKVGTQAADLTLTLPTAYAAVTGYLLSSTDAGVLSWIAAPAGFAWGTSVAAGSGTGLAMTSDALGGGTPFITMAHTASGTLTINSTDQFSLSTSRTHTAATSVTDNFENAVFSRTNVMNNAGGTLISAGAIVQINGSDTATAGSMNPAYDGLQINPGLRSTGSSIKINVPNSVAVVPTTGHISVLLGDTQSNAQNLLRLNTGLSNSQHKAISIVSAGGNCIDIDLNGTANAGAGVFVDIDPNNASSTVMRAFYADISDNASSGSDPLGVYVINRTTALDTSNIGGFGIGVNQQGVGGTAFYLTTGDNVNSSTNGLVNYTISNTQSGASVIQKIDLGSSAQAHTGVLVVANNASTTLTAHSVTFSTTGTGIGYHATSSKLGGGEQFMNFAHTASGTLTACTVDKATIASSRTYTLTSGSVTDNYNLAYILRTNITTGAGGTLLAQGSVLHLQNVATQTAGTLTDTVPCLKLTQDNDSTGGHILFNTYSGVPLVDGTLYFDGTDFKARVGGVTKTFTLV